MTIIQAGSTPLTLINVFTVAPERQGDELIAHAVAVSLSAHWQRIRSRPHLP